MSLWKTLGTVAKGLVKGSSATVNKLVKDGGGVAGAANNVSDAGKFAAKVVATAAGAVTGGLLAGPLAAAVGNLGGSAAGKFLGSTVANNLIKSGTTTLQSKLTSKAVGSAITKGFDSLMSPKSYAPTVIKDGATFSPPLTGLQKTVFPSSSFTSTIPVGGGNEVDLGKGFGFKLPSFGNSSGDVDGSKKPIPVWAWVVGGVALLATIFGIVISLFKRKR